MPRNSATRQAFEAGCWGRSRLVPNQTPPPDPRSSGSTCRLAERNVRSPVERTTGHTRRRAGNRQRAQRRGSVRSCKSSRAASMPQAISRTAGFLISSTASITVTSFVSGIIFPESTATPTASRGISVFAAGGTRLSAKGRVIGKTPCRVALGSRGGPLVALSRRETPGRRVEIPPNQRFSLSGAVRAAQPHFSRAMLWRVETRCYSFQERRVSSAMKRNIGTRRAGAKRSRTFSPLSSKRAIGCSAQSQAHESLSASPGLLPVVRTACSSLVPARLLYLQADICRSDLLLKSKGHNILRLS